MNILSREPLESHPDVTPVSQARKSVNATDEDHASSKRVFPFGAFLGGSDVEVFDSPSELFREFLTIQVHPTEGNTLREVDDFTDFHQTLSCCETGPCQHLRCAFRGLRRFDRLRALYRLLTDPVQLNRLPYADSS